MHTMKRQKSELPLDTIQSNILPRLPFESLARFQCVCKHWKSLFSTQEFIKLHMSRNHEKLLILDPSSRPATFHSIDCEHLDYPETTIENVPSEVNPKQMLLLASLDGLVCVGFKNSRRLMFWNPLTGAHKYLIYSKYHGHGYVPYSDAIGFYYDSLDDCYKILHVNRTSSGSCMAYIYSQRLDTWKKINFLENAQRFSEKDWSPVTFSNGSLYFTVKVEDLHRQRLIVISFDVNSEKFKEIQCPNTKKCTRLSGKLEIVKDCIHLWVSYGMNIDFNWHTELDLWRLNGEQGWTMVSSISINNGYNNQADTLYIPISIVRNVDWLVLGESDGSFCITDRETKSLPCLYNCSWLHHEGLVNTVQRVMYIETLVSPHQGSKRHTMMSLRPRKGARRDLHATQ